MKLTSPAIAVLACVVCRSAAAGSVTVPMQLVGNFPVIIVRVDGIDVPLTFDLGSDAALVLKQTVIDRVKHLQGTDPHAVKDPMGNVIRFVNFTLPQMQIGDAVFTNVIGRPDLHDASYQATELGQQGSFGPTLLQAFKVVLDYPRRRFTLIAPDSTDKDLAKCSGVTVSFLPEWNGDPVTKATTDFGELNAVWDTGAPESLLRKAKAHKLSDSVVDETTTTKRLMLGGSDFGPLKLVVADYEEPAGTDMYIGYTFFIHHIVCIDFPGKRFLIQQ